jgi:hypothetical protein
LRGSCRGVRNRSINGCILRSRLGDLIGIAREEVLFKLLGCREGCAVHGDAHYPFNLVENALRAAHQGAGLIDQILRPHDRLLELRDVLFDGENPIQASTDDC